MTAASRASLRIGVAVPLPYFGAQLAAEVGRGLGAPVRLLHPGPFQEDGSRDSDSARPLHALAAHRLPLAPLR